MISDRTKTQNDTDLLPSNFPSANICRPAKFRWHASWIALVMTAVFSSWVQADQQVPETITDIVIEGNETIPASTILQEIISQPNRSMSNRQLREDKRRLMSTRWFYSVTERFENRPQGAVLIFSVRERPIVRKVEFRGIKKIKLKELASWTGLKVGSPFDHIQNREAENRIQQEYKERGFFFAKVKLVSGSQPTDRDVIFQINEGPKVRVDERRFNFIGQEGMTGPSALDQIEYVFGRRQSKDGSYISPSAAQIRTKLQSKESWFGLFGGQYKPEMVDQDVASIKRYYQSQGFFDVKVTGTPQFSKNRASVRLLYTIDEGIPFKVRNIKLNGNYVIPSKRLLAGAELQKGRYFNVLPLSKDVSRMLQFYDSRGHYFASIVPVPKFTEQAGVVDVVFEIDEDRPRFIRLVNAKLLGDHPHTMETVPINLFQLEPGDRASPSLINRGRSRIGGSGILDNVDVRVTPVDPEQTRLASQNRTIRGQDGVGYQPSWQSLQRKNGTHNSPFIEYGHSISPNAESSIKKRHSTSTAAGYQEAKAKPDNRQSRFESSVLSNRTPVTNAVASHQHRQQLQDVITYQAAKPQLLFSGPPKALLNSAFPSNTDDDVVVRGQSPNGRFFQPPQQGPQPGDAVLEGSPYNNQFRSLPPGWVDVDITAQEGRTGRLMFGAGLNSDAGIVGSFVWDERNFDLFRPPQTFADLIEGRAFRGGGQRFRLEAAPGDQVSRYVVSWTDPYFLFSDYSLGVSGFFFNRFYPDWDETRLGGRVTIGKQISPEWSISGNIRLEDVEVNSARNTVASTAAGMPVSVPELQSVLGNNFLSSIGGTLTHDTRDSSMIPSSGHLNSVTFEQAFGDFVYPRIEGETRNYFTLYQRPDSSGKQVLTLAGNLGWSGDETPIFERYFAGGFQSFRGFEFRGVTPRGEDNISTGGTFQALGTAEYRVPLTADDMLNVVVFSDFGTVDQDVSFDNFRVTVGVGLRVVVPALGPVPLAFDFGFPVKSQEFDDERIFSFFVGLNR
ncbi:MAG: BamA/TamA family outer membrane protein [Fuerstiella sp.]